MLCLPSSSCRSPISPLSLLCFAFTTRSRSFCAVGSFIRHTMDICKVWIVTCEWWLVKDTCGRSLPGVQSSARKKRSYWTQTTGFDYGCKIRVQLMFPIYSEYGSIRLEEFSSHVSRCSSCSLSIACSEEALDQIWVQVYESYLNPNLNLFM